MEATRWPESWQWFVREAVTPGPHNTHEGFSSPFSLHHHDHRGKYLVMLQGLKTLIYNAHIIIFFRMVLVLTEKNKCTV